MSKSIRIAPRLDTKKGVGGRIPEISAGLKIKPQTNTENI